MCGVQRKCLPPPSQPARAEGSTCARHSMAPPSECKASGSFEYDRVCLCAQNAYADPAGMCVVCKGSAFRRPLSLHEGGPPPQAPVQAALCGTGIMLMDNQVCPFAHIPNSADPDSLGSPIVFPPVSKMSAIEGFVHSLRGGASCRAMWWASLTSTGTYLQPSNTGSKLVLP